MAEKGGPVAVIRGKLRAVDNAYPYQDKLQKVKELFVAITEVGLPLLAKRVGFRATVLAKTFHLEHSVREPWFATWREQTFHASEIRAVAAALIQNAHFVSTAEAALARSQQAQGPHTDVYVDDQVAVQAVAVYD